MSLSDIPDYVLYIIMDYIPDNKGSISLYSCCSYFKNLFEKYGYLKELSNSPLRNDAYTLAINSAKHKKTLNMISIFYTWDPQYCIFYWPKTVFFSYCTSRSVINPSVVTDTEVMYIYNDHNKNIIVNWKKFPKLRQIKLTEFNVNFTGIEVCENLKSIKIGLSILENNNGKLERKENKIK